MAPIGQVIDELLPVRKTGEEEEELKPTRVTGEKSADFYRGLAKATSIGPTKRKPVPSPLSQEYWRGVSEKTIERIPGLAVKAVKEIPQLGPKIMTKVVEPTLGFIEKNLTKTGWEMAKEASPIALEVTKEIGKSLWETTTHPFATLYNDPVRFASDATIIVGGALKVAGKTLEVAPRVVNAYKRMEAFKKVGRPPLEADLKVVAQSMVDDADKYQSALEKMAATSGRRPEDIKTWREMAIERVPQKAGIYEKKAPPKPRGIPKTKIRTTGPEKPIKKAKTKAVEDVVKEPVPAEVPKEPDVLNIPSSAMGMSLEEFEAARASGELISGAPRGMKKAYTAGGDLKEAFSELVVPRIAKDVNTIKQMFHSPDSVFAKSPHTMKNYEMLDQSNLLKMSWSNHNTVRTERARKFIKKDSPLDYAINKTRNKQVDASKAVAMSDAELAQMGLLKDEIIELKGMKDVAIRFDEYLDKTIDINLRHWGTTKVPVAEERRLWKLAEDFRAGKKIDPKALDGMAPESVDVLNIYKHRIPKYITHLFPKKEALDFLQSEMVHVNHMLGKIKPTSKRYKYWVKRKTELEESLAKISTSKNPLDALGPEAKAAYERMYGGEPVFFDYLPKRVSNKFFEPRRGKEGYDPSAIKSFYTYLAWMGRKIYDEPVVKYIHDTFDKVPMELREYMKWYVQDYMGYLRNPMDSLYGSVKSLMWTKALGFNPRSAVVNMTQRINILADSNPKDVVKAWANGFTREGKMVYNSTGLSQAIPQVMLEAGEEGNALAMLRNYAGWMFSKVENGNVKLAFLTGMEEAQRKGKSLGEAMMFGIKKAEKTQFRYGKIGTPRALRGAGGVAFQFWSYPIKQLEFLSKLWREDKKRFVAWVVMSEGTNQTLQNFFDTDLSSAVGVGLNWDEALKGIEALSEGDASEFFYRLTKRGGLVSGGGILPYGPGPAVEFATKDLPDAASKLLQALLGQEAWDEFFGSASKALEPGAIRRGRQAIGALVEGPDEQGLYPIRRIGGGVLPKGGVQYKEKPVDIAKRTLVARPMVETKQSREMRARTADQKTITAVSQRISDLLVLGKDEQAEKLSKAWGGIWPSREGVKAAYRRYLGEHPKDTRALAKFRAMFLEEYK